MIPQLEHLSADGSRPRVTYYNDSLGERIELSGTTVLRWVNKAGNWLQDEMDAGPGTRVVLALPADHWRTVYWILAVWAVGATVSDDEDGDVRVGMDDPAADLSEPRASLAPSDLTGQPDAFTPYVDPEPDDLALTAAGRQLTYAALTVTRPQDQPRVVAGDDLVASVAEVFGRDGSLVMFLDDDPAERAHRARTEGVAAD